MVADALEQGRQRGRDHGRGGQERRHELEVVEGMQFDRGYISPYFVTERREDGSPMLERRLDPHPREEASSACRTMLPLLEARRAAGPVRCVIVAEDVEGEALATLVVNKLRGAPQGRGREGAGLRRSPQGDARGHRAS
jgi:chaperonin GroEL